jgi:hypothetical protein
MVYGAPLLASNYDSDGSSEDRYEAIARRIMDAIGQLVLPA